jgi:hypothetical protein
VFEAIKEINVSWIIENPGGNSLGSGSGNPDYGLWELDISHCSILKNNFSVGIFHRIYFVVNTT